MRLLLSLFIALLTTASLSAQDMTFNDWDTDQDGVIERYEFASKFVTDVFENWERQDDFGVVEEGFFRESYAGLDTDNDNMLSDEEWMVGYNYFYKDYLVVNDPGFYDADRDGFVTYDEYYDALYDTAYFSDIDVDNDNFLSEYELAYYVFDNWDFDDSQTLSRSEFYNFDWYYVDI